MLQRSVTLMRRLSWTRSKVSMSGVTGPTLLYSQHSFNGETRLSDDVRGEFHPRFQVVQRLAQFFEGVAPHIGALAAITVLIGNKIELFPWRKFFERMAHAALGHHDELLGIVRGTPIDNR